MPIRPRTGSAQTAPESLRSSTIWRYAAGSLGTGGFSTLPGLVLLYYMTDTLAVPALWAGLVIGAAKVWDVIADPVIGALSDADERRTGSRRRFLLIGTIALPVLFVLTFAVPEGSSPVVAGVWVLVAFVASATAFSVYQVPYIALPAAIAPSYDERTKLLTARVIVLTIAILLFGGGGPALRALGGGGESGHLLMAVVCAALLLVGFAVSIGSAPKGDRLPSQGVGIARAYREAWDVMRHGRSLRALMLPFFLQAIATGLMLAAAQYVATYVMRSEDAVTLLFVALIAPAVVAAPAWQWLSGRTSKRAAFQLATVVFVVACLGLVPSMWVPDAWIYVPVALAGVAYAGMQSLPMAMLPDAMVHDLRRAGENRSGVIGGVWTAAETTGFALGGVVLSLVLGASGYVASSGQDVAQPDSAIVGISIAFTAVPALLALVSLWPLRAYRLDRASVGTESAGGVASDRRAGDAA